MKKKFKKQSMLAIPYLEFCWELTDKEASIISGGEIKITQQQVINNRVITGENVQLCSGTLQIVNGKVIKDTRKCVNKPFVNFDLKFPEFPKFPRLTDPFVNFDLKSDFLRDPFFQVLAL